MKAIILAAGYGTRLYPLTKNLAKPLLEIGGEPIIEHIVRKIDVIDNIDKIFVVTNDKFFDQFQEWLAGFEQKIPIEIVNDNTTSNGDRLGSLGDIQFVIDKENIDEDILVVAGDNLFDCDLKEIDDFFLDKKETVVVLYDVKDLGLAKQYGVVEIDSDQKMIEFEEKPEEPKSTLASTGIYFYPKQIVERLKDYLGDGSGDKAGNFLEWIHKREAVYGFVTEERWYDIGSIEQLEEAKKSKE